MPTATPISAARRLRDALFATKDYDGIGGKISCNEHGDCAGFKFAVYEFTNGDRVDLRNRHQPEEDLSVIEVELRLH